MAFNQQSNAQRSNTTNSNADWKAQGYLNIYLPSKSTKTGWRKLVGVPLKDSVTSEKDMRAWVEKNPEAACNIILRSMRIEYQSADTSGSGFDFDAMGAAHAAT